MDYTVTQFDHNTRIGLNGQFTFADNQKFKQILELAEHPDTKAIELNFAEVTFIDSAGLGMLLLLRDRCQNRHLPISLHSAQGQVHKVFLISKFDQLFSIRS